jgi:hypothetical protein
LRRTSATCNQHKILIEGEAMVTFIAGLIVGFAVSHLCARLAKPPTDLKTPLPLAPASTPLSAPRPIEFDPALEQWCSPPTATSKTQFSKWGELISF